MNSLKTILVTDSGLGGMSVFAQIANHFAQKAQSQNISLIYFNAWPEQNKGYNNCENMNQKARIFDNALNAMGHFKPDIILIACNTLSVIYPFTSYSKTARTTVSGIVDHGVQMIYESLMAEPDSHVIIFGTPTTIAEKTHQTELVKLGIDPDRITSQGCTNLAGKIERNPFNSEVSKMINANALKAVLKMRRPVGKVYAALCCTHFGYCKDLFQKALSKYIKKDVIILNPNERMADQVMNDQVVKESKKADVLSFNVNMQIVSKVFWEPERIDAYVRLLKGTSPEAIKALSEYEWNPDLFEV